MAEKNEPKKEKKPTVWGMAGYAAVVVILGLFAIFARRLAQGIEGPILCIYVAVLPKYVFGIALILAGTEAVVYGIRFFRDDPRVSLFASGFQVAALAVFLFLIFPLALKEGVPAGGTYDMMRVLMGLMLLVTVWDFVSEIRRFRKQPGKTGTSE